MKESLGSEDSRNFVGGTNEFARLASDASAEANEAAAATEKASIMKPEDFYANPQVLDRATFEQLFPLDNSRTEYEKTKIYTPELVMDRVAHGYDAETREPVMNEWDKPGCDLQQQLNTCQKPFMEFGGPTYAGFPVAEGLDLPQKVQVSNVYPGYPVYTAEGQTVVGGVDLVADITAMPLSDESLGAVFASAILEEQHDQAIAESFRVLEPGGLAFWQNGKIEDLQTAQHCGFEVVRAMSTLLPRSRPQLSFVFQKPEQPNHEPPS